GDMGDVDQRFARQRLDALEDMREDLVEAVDMPLVLHQRRTREIVEALDVVLNEPGLNPFEQGQIFAERDRHARRLHLEEKGHEHQPSMSYSMKPVRRAALS